MAGGDYGRIRHTFWTDPDIKRGLTVEQKALLLYFFTSPHSSLIGLYYCPLEYISVETGIPVDRVREYTNGALARYVSYDEVTEEVFVHRAGRHQVGDELKAGDKRVKAIVKAVSETHSPRLVAKFLELYAAWPLNIEAPEVPPGEAPSKPLRSQSSSSAVAVHEQSSPAAKGDDPPAGSADALRLRVELEAHADANNYGPSDRLIAIGEDISVWRTNEGEVIPMVDRLRLLRLADAHLAKPGSKATDLRGSLRYVIVQQYDPIVIQRASERQGSPRSAEPPGPALRDPQALELAKLKDDHPKLFADVLAEFEACSWWESAGTQFQRSQMISTIRERLRGAA